VGTIKGQQVKFLLKLVFWLHAGIYRLSGGVVLGRVAGMPVLILYSVGGKTGKKRTTPLTYLQDGEAYVITASMGGAPNNPGWYHNLKNNPQTIIQIKGETLPVIAEEASPVDRQRLWAELTAIASIYEAYQQKTSRQIPMIILRPIR
jgi:deazaflavin-dependent oxidoreductase (nitroreductase family)